MIETLFRILSESGKLHQVRFVELLPEINRELDQDYIEKMTRSRLAHQLAYHFMDSARYETISDCGEDKIPRKTTIAGCYILSREDAFNLLTRAYNAGVLAAQKPEMPK